MSSLTSFSSATSRLRASLLKLCTFPSQIVSSFNIIRFVSIYYQHFWSTLGFVLLARQLSPIKQTVTISLVASDWVELVERAVVERAVVDSSWIGCGWSTWGQRRYGIWLSLFLSLSRAPPDNSPFLPAGPTRPPEGFTFLLPRL
jgi:hypothetical protein